MSAIYKLPSDSVIRKPLLCEVPIVACRNSLGFGFHESFWHPFTQTLLAYKQHGKRSAFEFLKSYYDDFCPSNAACALGVEDLPQILHEFSAESFMLPWATHSPDESKLYRHAVAVEESLQYGRFRYSLNDGMKLFGPVSKRFAEAELNRLIGTYESIQRRGYDRRLSEDDIVIQVLRNNAGDETYLVCGGHHRVAALAALGHSHACARLLVIPKVVICQSDIPYFWNVRNGLFSYEAAEYYYMKNFFSDLREDRAIRLGLWSAVQLK